jgi:hypothetical protein
LVARLWARLRAGSEAAAALRVSDQTARLFDIFTGHLVALRTEEMLHPGPAVGDVLGLSHCACVFMASGRDEAGSWRSTSIPGFATCPSPSWQYPEVVESVRSGATVLVPDVMLHPLFFRTRVRWTQAAMVPDVPERAAIPFQRDDGSSGRGDPDRA